MRKSLSVYVIAYLTLLLVVCGLLCLYPKLELHLLLNSWHTSIQDTFFKYYTMIAEGPIYALALLPLLWKQIRLTLFMGLCELTGGAFLQLLKHTLCLERPICAFEHISDTALPVVAGVDMHYGNSFPSGHASTFFVFCTCTALFLAYRHQRNKETCHPLNNILFHLSLLSLLTLAALGAFSRVYLSQHFLLDVCVGSIIGFTTPFILFHFGRKKILKLKNEV
jgi:membrane-associated phospholipid phosphatase